MPRPRGYEAQGRYGRGVKTVVTRVPAEWKEGVPRLLQELPNLIERYESDCHPTSVRWQHARRMIRELKELLPR